MRLLLKEENARDGVGPIAVASGESLSVGQSNLADLTIASDEELYSIHFDLSVEREDCWIKDLKSSKGTLLNQERIGKARLRSGDQIQAGQTLFKVRLQPGVVANNSLAENPADALPWLSFASKPCLSGAIKVQIIPLHPVTVAELRSAKKGLVEPPLEATPFPNCTDATVTMDYQEHDILESQTFVDDSLTGANSTLVRRPVPIDEFLKSNPRVPDFLPGTVAVLAMKAGSEIGRTIRIGLGKSLDVGRAAGQNDVAFPQELAMSGRHFHLDFTSKGLFVHDVGSRNGTYINGFPCEQAVLQNGDHLSAGDAAFEISFEPTSGRPNNSSP